MSQRPRLLFVSPRFLFPADQGGKIRTTQILRGMRGGRFEIILASPEPVGATQKYADDLAAVCDRFLGWPELPRGRLHGLTRLRHLLSALPVPVIDDYSPAGAHQVQQALVEADLVVFDFLHAMILAPERFDCPSVLFTHNVEAEIFRRHAEVSTHPVKKAVWRQQFRKMQAYEQTSLRRFATVVAVSQRDADTFKAIADIGRVATIPTGVDLDFFAYQTPGNNEHIVFTGAMDWQANIDGITWFMDAVWPQVAAQRPQARVTIVGRNPSPLLVERARRRKLPFTFTGFVDDIRPHVHAAAAYIIPLRVGGGTRIKAFEAMAMGLPVVSTGLGVEGLPITADEQYLHADTAEAFSAALVRLLADRDLAAQLSCRARDYVATHCSSQAVARCFEAICWDTFQAGSLSD